MNLQEHKVLFLVATGVLALLVVSPALQRLLVIPQTEFFTEFWILGPKHKAEGYPSNVTSGSSYNMFIGVTNQLGHEAYYSIQVKFRNQNQSAPDSFKRTPSSLPPLFSFNTFVADKETLEIPLSFSFNYVYNADLSQVDLTNLVIGDNVVNLEGTSISWGEQSRFFGSLFFELWFFDDSAGSFRYHERFTDLRFNMTVPNILEGL